MPHSVSPDSSPPSSDIELSDAPPAPPSSPPQDGATLSEGSSGEDTQTETAQAAQTSSKTNLEAMFDDDEEEDEFTSSSAVNSSAPQLPVTNLSHNATSPSDPSLLRAFYQRLFPYRPLFHWLNHSAVPSPDFTNREFAFTANGAYIRYQSFASADLFRKQCVSLIPSRFEIGPVYSTNPRDRKILRRAAAFKPVSKELVFDVDLTDYDEIRTCCSKATICHRCWAFMRMAIRVIDATLREDFGFCHILWVYSGRRGIHAWVCDRRAREMGDEKRRAIAGYMELLKGGDATKKKVNMRRPLHPHVERSLRLLRDSFTPDILHSQDPFASPAGSAHLLGLLNTDATLTTALSQKWSANPHRTSTQKWSDIDTLASDSANTSSTFDAKKLLEAKQDIVLEYTYPRLDANVSKHLNHLLKSPFCVHPGTGRVCVPIDPRTLEDFDPEEVPTVSALLGEVDAWTRDAGNEGRESERKIPDWEKTSLRPYVEYFKGFVQRLLRDEGGGVIAGKKRKEKGSDIPAEADGMEF